jgi:ABC-type sugar transport system permease subunit
VTDVLQQSLRVRADQGASTTRMRTRSMRRKRSVTALLFMVPFLAVNAIVILGPSVATVYYSFTKWSGLGTPSWVGLRNYRDMLTSSEFWAAATHNLVWTVIFLGFSLTLGVTGAVLLAQVRRGRLALRLLYFLPYTIASVVTASIWQNIYDPDRGVGRFLSHIGIGNVAVLGDERYALPAVSFINVWAFWGFIVVVCMAALQSVDPSLYEAARIDGASRWQQFRHVTLPGIRPTLAFLIVITIMFSLLVFDYVWITTQGGPAGATEVVGTLLYKEAFERFDAGYAAALGVSSTAVCGLVGLLYVALRRRGWEV